MTQKPYMPLWIGDYRRDTTQLSTEQHGAYLLLLMAMWVAEGFLQNDPVKLARICGVTARRWPGVSADVMGLFQETSDGRITHKRVRSELLKAGAKSAARAEAGRKGGKAKHRKVVSKSDSKTVTFSERVVGTAPLDLFDNSKQLPAGPPSGFEANLTRAGATDNHTHTQTPPSESILPAPPNGDASHARTLSDRVLDAEFPKWYSGAGQIGYGGYPAKQNRGQAERAYRKARREGASLDQLIEGVKRYIVDKPADRDWRYPATWLNGKGWLDEPAPAVHHQSTGPPDRDDGQRRQSEWQRVLDEAKEGKKHG